MLTRLKRISTHTLTWSVTWKPSTAYFNPKTFQLTRSRGAWRVITLSDPMKNLNFNSHAHVERDVMTFCLPCFSKFQLTRSRGAWPHVLRVLLLCRLFQLTRSRGAWPCVFSFLWAALPISTHTLTWSVTPLTAYLSENVWISTHTLTWSVTFFGTVDSKVLFISTHTLTWSVTELIRHFLLSLKFQLTRSRGAWLVRLFKLSHLSIFQLTRSRGAWHFALLL